MMRCPVARQLRLALCAVNCSLLFRLDKSKFLPLLLQDSEVWSSNDHPSFPCLYALNCQETCVFVLLLQSVHPFNIWEECWEALCNPNTTVSHNSLQVFCTPKCLLRGFLLFWRTKWKTPNFAINKKSPLLDNVNIFTFNIWYNAKHSASKVDKDQNGRQKQFYVKAKE